MTQKEYITIQATLGLKLDTLKYEYQNTSYRKRYLKEKIQQLENAMKSLETLYNNQIK